MAKRPNLSDTQIVILQGMKLKRPYTREQLSEVMGFTANGTNLGPTYNESRENQPNSLVSRGMVRVMQDEIRGKKVILYTITKTGVAAAKRLTVQQKSNEKKVPPSLLDPVVKEMQSTRNYGLERFTDDDIDKIRVALGDKYKTVSITGLKQQIVNRRKQGAYASETARKIRAYKRLEREFGAEGTIDPGFLTGKMILRIDEELDSLQQ